MANMIGQISSEAVNKMTRLRSTRDAITLVLMLYFATHVPRPLV